MSPRKIASSCSWFARKSWTAVRGPSASASSSCRFVRVRLLARSGAGRQPRYGSSGTSWSRSPATTARQASRAAATSVASSDRRQARALRARSPRASRGSRRSGRARPRCPGPSLRQDLEELELVDDVVLEPEDDALRAREQLVAARELRLDRGRVAPSLLGEEPRAHAARLGGIEGERPDVQDVVPGEDDSLDRPVCRSVLAADSPFVTCSGSPTGSGRARAR